MRKYFGDAKFYKTVLVIAVPLLIQQLITSFVNMLDNIMIGQTGTLAMSGVSVSNQIITVFNLAIFGSVAASSIFGAQFAGKEDNDGVRHCLRFKLIVESLIAILFISIFMLFGNKLVSLFLHSEQNDVSDVAQTMSYSLDYLRIMTLGFIPFALSQSLSSSMREAGETRLPMVASITAVVVNFIGNSILIFGLFGAPALGPTGAAIATVISRFAELAVIIFFARTNHDRFPFYDGLFHNFSIPMSLIKRICIKGFPLVLNELLWAIGQAMITQCYSTRGIDALAAYNISSTITNLFFVSNIAMGDSISILVGQQLGAGKTEEAIDTDRKMIVFTVMVAIIFGTLLLILAPNFPNFYQTSSSVKEIATIMLRYGGLTMWISAIYNASYFTLRCGGKTIITFLFDSVGTIFVSFPIAYILAHFTTMNIEHMYLTICLVDLYKVILGLFLVNKKIWVNNLVSKA